VTSTSASTGPGSSDGQGSDRAGRGDGATTAELTVEGMHCGACVALIEESLAEQSGVRAASVDLEAARAVVHYDPSLVGPDDLCATIAEAGYSATLVS
jgi:copper chaperone CopZ